MKLNGQCELCCRRKMDALSLQDCPRCALLCAAYLEGRPWVPAENWRHGGQLLMDPLWTSVADLDRRERLRAGRFHVFATRDWLNQPLVSQDDGVGFDRLDPAMALAELVLPALDQVWIVSTVGAWRVGAWSSAAQRLQQEMLGGVIR